MLARQADINNIELTQGQAGSLKVAISIKSCAKRPQYGGPGITFSIDNHFVFLARVQSCYTDLCP